MPETERLLDRIRGPKDLKALSLDELENLAGEVRQAICDQVAQTGGHLAPNLGVVELTLALHYVFDFSHDRLLFDVGHQCYPHKLLTGRLPLLSKLRTAEGMSGFPDPAESDYDLFAVGHAGTAISTAVGMARADDLLAGGDGRSDRCAVALVGDASIVNGVALEGVNNAGTLKRQFLTVLNDNGMSISQPQGAVSHTLDRLRVSHRFGDFKKRAKDIVEKLPGGHVIRELYHRGSDAMISAITTGHLFDAFGHICIGPVDGHDLRGLIDVLRDVKDVPKPVLLHAKTIKGKGYDFAEGDATKFHSPKPFTVNGCRVDLKSGGRSFTSAYADAMIDLMGEDEKVVAVTAAMPDGTGLSKVAEQFPDRTLDTGICESHAMDMCAGMAKAGLKPFFAVYSTFSQRALDQVFQEVALQGLPVRVCMDRAGYVGGDGAVHHGFMDISMFRVFPDAVLMAACDEPSLRSALAFMRSYEAGASFLRYPRDSVAATPTDADPPAFELGRAHPLRRPQRTPDLAVLAYGSLVYEALAAAETLVEQGIELGVYDARFAKPVDIALVSDLVRQQVPILTVEDHALAGGFGSAVIETASDAGLETRGIHRAGMPMRWIGPDSRAHQLAEAGLDAQGLVARAREVLGSPSPSLDQTAGQTVVRRDLPHETHVTTR